MNDNRLSSDWIAYHSGSGEVIFYKNQVTGEMKWATTLHARPVLVNTEEELTKVAARIFLKCTNNPGMTSEQVGKLFGSAARYLQERLKSKPENERQQAIAKVRSVVDKIFASRQLHRSTQPLSHTPGTIPQNSGTRPRNSQNQQNVGTNRVNSQIQTVGELMASQGYKISTVLVPPNKGRTQPLTHASSREYRVDPRTTSSYTPAVYQTSQELHIPRVNYNVAQLPTNQALTAVQIPPTQPLVYRGQHSLANTSNGGFRNPLTAVATTGESSIGGVPNQGLRSAPGASNGYNTTTRFQNISFDEFGNINAVDVTETHLTGFSKPAGIAHRQQQSGTNALSINQVTNGIPGNQPTQSGLQHQVSSTSSGRACATNVRKAFTPGNQNRVRCPVVSQIDLTNQNTQGFDVTGMTDISITNANSLRPKNSEIVVTCTESQPQMTAVGSTFQKSYEKMFVGALPFRHLPTLQIPQSDVSVPRCVTVDCTTTNKEVSDQHQRVVRMNGSALHPGVLINTTPMQEELDLLPRVASVVSLAPQTRETMIWRAENTSSPSEFSTENSSNTKTGNASLQDSEPVKVKIEPNQDKEKVCCDAENGSLVMSHSLSSTREQAPMSTFEETLNYAQAKERGLATGQTQSHSFDPSVETNQSSVASTSTYPVQNMKTELDAGCSFERPAEVTESNSPDPYCPSTLIIEVHDSPVKIKTEPVLESSTELRQECDEHNEVEIRSSERYDLPKTDNVHVTAKMEAYIDPVEQSASQCSTSSDCNEISLPHYQIYDNDFGSIEKTHSEVDPSASVEQPTDFLEATTTPSLSSIQVKTETSDGERAWSDISAPFQSSVRYSGLENSNTDRDKDTTLSEGQQVHMVRDKPYEGEFTTENTVGNTAGDENERVGVFSVLEAAESQVHVSTVTLESGQQTSTLNISFQSPSSNTTSESPAAGEEQCDAQLTSFKPENNCSSVAGTSDIELETNTSYKEAKVDCIESEESEVELVEVRYKSSDCPVVIVRGDSDEEIDSDKEGVSDEDGDDKDSEATPLPMYNLLDYLPAKKLRVIEDQREMPGDYCCTEEVTENNSELEVDSSKIERKRKMEDSRTLKKHKKQVRQLSDETTGESDSFPTNPDLQHECSICGKSFVEAESLELHQLEHTCEKPLHCRHCGISFSDFADLARHSCITLQERDCTTSQENVLHCESCGGDFTNPNDFEIHDCNQPRRRPLHCKYRGKSFSKSRNLLRHLSQHGIRNTLLQKSLLEAGELSHNMRPHDKTKKKTKRSEKAKGIKKNAIKAKRKVKVKRNQKEKLDDGRTEAEIEEKNEENKLLGTEGNSAASKHTSEVKSSADKFNCEKCGKTFKNEATFTKHQQRHVKPKEFHCEQCNKSYDTLSELNLHVQGHSAEKAFKCEHCPEAFKSASKLSVHRSKHTGEDPFTCEHCGKTFPDTNDLVKHLQRFHTGGKEFNCPHCDKAFGARDKLERHKRTHDKPYQCEECDKRFSELTHLTAHQRRHTGEKPFACDLCDKSYSREISLIVHKGRKHSNGKAGHYCSTCNKSFSSDDELKVHLKTHSLKTFKCEDCGKEFQLSVLLKRHFQKHHGRNEDGNGNFECKVCHRRFANAYRLQRHSAMHHEKTIKCTECDKLFFDNCDMKKHLRTHTGERPFKCTKCDWAFSQSSQLYKHLRNVHNESKKTDSDDSKKKRSEETFVCDYCSREFADITHLKRHFLTHTGDRPYQCKFCSSSFRERHHLSRHLKSFHRNHEATHSATLETESQGEQSMDRNSLVPKTARSPEEAENLFLSSKPPASVKSKLNGQSVHKPTPTQATEPLRKSHLPKEKPSSSSHNKNQSDISLSFAPVITTMPKTGKRNHFESGKSTVKIQRSKPTSFSKQSSNSSSRKTLRKSSEGNAHRSGEIESIVDKMLQQKPRVNSSQHKNEKVVSEQHPKRSLKLIEPLPLPLSGGKTQTPPPSPRKVADKNQISPSKMSELKRTMEMRRQLSKGTSSQPDGAKSTPAETQMTSGLKKQDVEKPLLNPEKIDHIVMKLKPIRSNSISANNCLASESSGQSTDFMSNKRKLLPESEAKTKRRFTLKDLADRVNNQSFSSSKDEPLRSQNVFEQILEGGFPKIFPSLKQVRPCYTGKLSCQQTLQSSEAKQEEAMQLITKGKSATDTTAKLRTCEVKMSVKSKIDNGDPRRKTTETSEQDAQSRAVQQQGTVRNKSSVSSSSELLVVEREVQETSESSEKDDNGLKKNEVEGCTNKDSSVISSNNGSEPTHGETKLTSSEKVEVQQHTNNHELNASESVYDDFSEQNRFTSESSVKRLQTSSIKNASGRTDTSEALCSLQSNAILLTPKSDQLNMKDTTTINSAEVDSSSQFCEVTSALEVSQQLHDDEKEKAGVGENARNEEVRKIANAKDGSRKGELVEEEQDEERESKKGRVKDDVVVEQTEKAAVEVIEEEHEKKEDENTSLERKDKEERKKAEEGEEIENEVYMAEELEEEEKIDWELEGDENEENREVEIEKEEDREAEGDGGEAEGEIQAENDEEQEGEEKVDSEEQMEKTEVELGEEEGKADQEEIDEDQDKVAEKELQDDEEQEEERGKRVISEKDEKREDEAGENDEAEVVESTKRQSLELNKIDDVASSSLRDEGSSVGDSSAVKMLIQITKQNESSYQCSEVSSSVEKSPQRSREQPSAPSRDTTKKDNSEAKKTSTRGQTSAKYQKQLSKREDHQTKTAEYVNNKSRRHQKTASQKLVPERPADTNGMRMRNQQRLVEGRSPAFRDQRNNRLFSCTDKAHQHQREWRSRSPVHRRRASPLRYSEHTKRFPAVNGQRRPTSDQRNSFRPRNQRSPYRREHRSLSREKERRRNFHHPSNDRFSSLDSRDKGTPVGNKNDASERPRSPPTDPRDSRPPPKRREHRRSSSPFRNQTESKCYSHNETPYRRRSTNLRHRGQHPKSPRDLPSLLPQQELEQILSRRNSLNRNTGQNADGDQKFPMSFQRDERPQRFGTNNMGPNSHKVPTRTESLPLPAQNGQRPENVGLNNSHQGLPTGFQENRRPDDVRLNKRPSLVNEHGSMDQRPVSPHPDRGLPSVNNAHFQPSFLFQLMPQMPHPAFPMPQNFAPFPPFINPWQK